jgi:hypothetical protein
MNKTKKGIIKLKRTKTQTRKKLKDTMSKMRLRNKKRAINVKSMKRNKKEDLQNKTLKKHQHKRYHLNMSGGIDAVKAKQIEGAEKFNMEKSKMLKLIQKINKGHKKDRIKGIGIVKKYIDTEKRTEVYGELDRFVSYVANLDPKLKGELSSKDRDSIKTILNNLKNYQKVLKKQTPTEDVVKDVEMIIKNPIVVSKKDDISSQDARSVDTDDDVDAPTPSTQADETRVDDEGDAVEEVSPASESGEEPQRAQPLPIAVDDDDKKTIGESTLLGANVDSRTVGPLSLVTDSPQATGEEQSVEQVDTSYVSPSQDGVVQEDASPVSSESKTGYDADDETTSQTSTTQEVSTNDADDDVDVSGADVSSSSIVSTIQTPETETQQPETSVVPSTPSTTLITQSLATPPPQDGDDGTPEEEPKSTSTTTSVEDKNDDKSNTPSLPGPESDLQTSDNKPDEQSSKNDRTITIQITLPKESYVNQNDQGQNNADVSIAQLEDSLSS